MLTSSGHAENVHGVPSLRWASTSWKINSVSKCFWTDTGVPLAQVTKVGNWGCRLTFCFSLSLLFCSCPCCTPFRRAKTQISSHLESDANPWARCSKSHLQLTSLQSLLENFHTKAGRHGLKCAWTCSRKLRIPQSPSSFICQCGWSPGVKGDAVSIMYLIWLTIFLVLLTNGFYFC